MIETDQLTKCYAAGSGRPPAVDRLNLRVQVGEIFGLLGPNGAGKTTTIGMLTTGVLPTSGSARIARADVAREPTFVKKMIGVVSQTNTLDRSLTVYKNLYYHGRYFAMPASSARAEAERLIDLFHLSDRRNSMVATLSGGMAQRLMLARAVMHRPQVLFLDEPTTGLDPQSRLDLWQLVRDLNDHGQTVVLTTHNMLEADELCDRVAIMDGGRVLALDTPSALRSSLVTDVVVSVRAEVRFERLEVVLAKVAGATRIAEVAGGANVSVQGNRSGLFARIAAAASEAGIDLRDVSISDPTLEDVFLNLTGKELRD